MIKNIYNEYADIKVQIAILEMKEEQLRPIILQQMIDNSISKKETDLGKFSISKLKVWTYPKKVIDLGEEFKEAKAKAQSTGEAEYTEQDSLRFAVVKL